MTNSASPIQPPLVRAALVAAAAIPLVYFLVSLRVPAVVNADSAMGFWVWDSMRAGAHFNHLLEPDPANIARDREVFIAWWSPGQYLLVAPWLVVGMSIGRAIACTALLSTWLALLGYWRLFRRLGFTPAASAGGLLLIATGWGTAHGFNMYLGGDVVLFGALPWLTLACVELAFASATRLLWLPVLFLAGTFLKLNFLVAAIGLAAFVFLARSGGWSGRKWQVPLAIGLAGALALTFGLVQWLFLSRGYTPVTVAPQPKPLSISLAFASMGIFMSAFSLSTLVDRVVLYPGHPLVQNFHEIDPWLWLLAPVCVATYVVAWRCAPSRTYRHLLLALTAAFTGVFTWLYWRGNNVGFSDRYYRIGGYLLLPAIAAAILRARGWARWLALGCAGVSVAYGVGGYVQRTVHLARLDNVGARGFSQPNISRPALRVVETLDARLPAGDALLLVPSVDIALELERHRRFALPGLRTSAGELRAFRWQGRPRDGLVILVDSAMANDGRLELLLNAFVDVPRTDWQSETIDGWTLWWDRPALTSVCREAIATARHP